MLGDRCARDSGDHCTRRLYRPSCRRTSSSSLLGTLSRGVLSAAHATVLFITAYFVAHNATDYKQAIAIATHATDTATAIYWGKQTAEFNPAMLEVEGCCRRYCYVKFAAHLYALSRGARRPLASLSQRKAWRYVTEVDADRVQEFCGALDGGLAG